jgi:hypothetical protein
MCVSKKFWEYNNNTMRAVKEVDGSETVVSKYVSHVRKKRQRGI